MSRRTALVTGASRGIGKSTAYQLAQRDIRVAVHYHKNEELAQKVLDSLPGDGHILLCGDLSDETSIQNIWDRAIVAFSYIDIVINNAGYCADHHALQNDFSVWQREWQRTIFTNLLGPAHLSYFAANAMTSSLKPMSDVNFGRGRIVNISSRGAFRGEPTAPAYGASKPG